MSSGLSQSKTALAVGLTASFLASGGTEPYVYTVVAGGAGGTIDPDSGIYTAPATLSDDPTKNYDTILVTDADDNTVTSQIQVGDALLLFCEIIQREMGLANGRVYIWDQKEFQPTDSGLYIAVSIASSKPYANRVNQGAAGWDTAEQSVNMQVTLDLDIMSRGPAAWKRKEEVIMALASIYSQAQQAANSFTIGRLPPGARFITLNLIDGAAIPYRFRISVNILYAVTKTQSVPYFDTFLDPTFLTDS